MVPLLVKWHGMCCSTLGLRPSRGRGWRPWVPPHWKYQPPSSLQLPDCEAEADVGPKLKIQIASFFAQAANWFKFMTRQQGAAVRPGCCVVSELALDRTESASLSFSSGSRKSHRPPGSVRGFRLTERNWVSGQRVYVSGTDYLDCKRESKASSSVLFWESRTSNLTDVTLLISANFSGKNVGIFLHGGVS